MILVNIKALCKRKKMSVSDLEKALGFGAGTIYRWSSASPTVDNLQKVAGFFHCSLDKLVKPMAAK